MEASWDRSSGKPKCTGHGIGLPSPNPVSSLTQAPVSLSGLNLDPQFWAATAYLVQILGAGLACVSPRTADCKAQTEGRL